MLRIFCPLFSTNTVIGSITFFIPTILRCNQPKHQKHLLGLVSLCSHSSHCQYFQISDMYVSNILIYFLKVKHPMQLNFHHQPLNSSSKVYITGTLYLIRRSVQHSTFKWRSKNLYGGPKIYMAAQKFIWRPNNLYGGPIIYMEAQKILYGCPIIYMDAQSEVERKTLCEYCWKQS